MAVGERHPELASLGDKWVRTVPGRSQGDQNSADSREHRKEHCTFAQFRTCTQADEPGRVGRDEAEDGEDGKNELSVQSELLRQDVGNQLKDNEQQKKVKPPGW